MGKIDLGNRTVLDDGTVICKSSALIELLYAGQDLDGIFCQDIEDEQEWLSANKERDTAWPGPIYTDKPMYTDIDWYQHWFTPEPWASIDLKTWCIDRCKSDAEIARVEFELNEFESRDMFPIMKHLIYCVDTWRKNGIFWGVGRGSSVCSFVLYLIGINRINPLEFDLDLNEWLHK